MPISSHLHRTSLVNKEFIVWPKRELFLEGPTRKTLHAGVPHQNAGFASSCPLEDSVWARLLKGKTYCSPRSGHSRTTKGSKKSQYIVINMKTICNPNCEVKQQRRNFSSYIFVRRSFCYLHIVLYLLAFLGALLILISFCEISS